MEAELEDERKQRAIAINARNKLQGDIQGMEQQLEMANKVKEDAVKQYKKIFAQMKDFQRELDEARLSREEMAAQAKDNEKKVRGGGGGFFWGMSLRLFVCFCVWCKKKSVYQLLLALIESEFIHGLTTERAQPSCSLVLY